MPAMGCCELIDVFPASVLCRACARRPVNSGRIVDREFVFFELRDSRKLKIVVNGKIGHDGK
jgi:hypothetical protein